MKSKSSPRPDAVLTRIADYAVRRVAAPRSAYLMARYCLLDALACAFDALAYPECTKLLGPVVPGTRVPNGARVPGTDYELDPIKAAFDIGTAIRWLDFNNAWFAAEGGNPSNNLGAILAVSDYVSRNDGARRRAQFTVGDVLATLIKAYEIQGVLQLENSLVEVGLDCMVLTNIASTAVATQLLGGTRDEIINAVSNAWLDGVSPRLYRIGHSTGWRKSWAAGDATSRGVMHGLFALRGEMGYPAALSAPRWGFCDAMLRGKPVVLPRPFGSYIVENILFKVPFASQFHAQTASECAVKLHPLVVDRIDDIKTIHVRTHARTIQAADKRGPLSNAADRDHCLQYIIAIVLLHGKLAPDDYEDDVASDPRIDALRSRTVVSEDKSYTRDFYDARKRSNCNAMRIEFRDGSSTPEIRIDYPLGHPRRRSEGLPLVEQKFRRSVERAFAPKRQRQILDVCNDVQRFPSMPLERFMDLLVK